MLSAVSRLLAGLRLIIAGLRGYALRLAALFTALQVMVVAILIALTQFRKRRNPPREGYPWESQPEIELESGGVWFKLYSQGTELFDEMLAEIERAEREIFIESFIWKDDETGRRFVEALARKAREGVDVYAIFDGVANFLVVSPEFKRFPEEINTLHFKPLSGPASYVDPRSIFRDHRKIFCVDDHVAFVGGFNIGSLYASRRWRDTHLRIRGTEVPELKNAFIDFWNEHRHGDLPAIQTNNRPRSWVSDAVLHRNDPYLRIFPIRAMYLEAIDRATGHIKLTSAYFLPDRALRRSLIEAARRGVEVEILLPRDSNHPTVDWLSRRHWYELLENGVRIFAYENIMIHSKTATIDGVWSTVGTANIDRLSLLQNYEVNLEVYDRRLSAQVERMFELDKTNAVELTLENWTRRPLPAKIAERVISTLEPLF
jgi:cardiolipin synthase